MNYTMFFYLLYKLAFLTIFMLLLIQLKYSVKKTIIIVSVFSLPILILNYQIGLYYGSVILGNIFPLTATVPAFIGFLFVSRQGFFKVLFSMLTVSIFSMLAKFAGQLTYMYWNNANSQFLFEIIADALLLFVLIRFFRKPYLKMFNALVRGWGIFCLVPGLLMALLFGLLYYPSPLQERQDNVPLIFFAFALTFALYLIIYLNFENISQHYEMKHNRHIMMLQLEMHKKEYESLQENINTMNIYRHDMKHHLNAIDTLLCNNNTAEALNFTRRLDRSLENTALKQYCENYFINVILSAYIKKAEDEHIKVRCEVVVPEKINIDPVEIGLIFANATENAINACKKIVDADRRELSILCKEQKGQLFIRISNPYVGEVKFDGESPVADSPEHGTGTKSIATIVQKNGGIFSFTARNGIFDTTVSLNY
jgi:hypothetical protein